MINPNKVINFLDITGSWDPRLIFDMMGALAIAFVSFRLILKCPVPILVESFHISRKSSVDKSLIFGAAILGTGRDMSGYCPGPAVTGLGLLSLESVIMVVAIYMGFIAYKCVSFAYKAKST